MKRALVYLILAAVAVTGLAACGAGADRAQRMTLAALNIKAPSQTSTTSSAHVPRCTHLTASLPPPATMPSPGAMPPGSYMATIQRRGYLIAGVDQNTLLFSYFNPLDGHVEGFEVDLLHELARAIFGNPDAIHFKALTTAERITAVGDGSVDIVADAVTITCARRQQADFSTVYYDAGQKILVPSDSSARSVKDLAGKRVCATIDSTTIQTLAGLVPRVVPYGVPQRTDCLVALQEGLVSAISSDDSILLGYKAQDPYTKIVGPSLAPEPYGMAISKAHPDFVRFVNGVLAQLRKDGGWRAIYRRWLGKYTRVPTPPAATYY